MTVWQRGWLVRDWHELPLEEISPGEHLLTVGLYNRDTGERYQGIQRNGAPIPDGELQIATVTIPIEDRH